MRSPQVTAADEVLGTYSLAAGGMYRAIDQQGQVIIGSCPTTEHARIELRRLYPVMPG